MRLRHGSPSARTTTGAADCRPRTSPPSASAASSAAIRRAARSPPAASNAALMAAGTVSRSIMLAWQVQCSPITWPAHGTQRSPVCAAARPAASTMPTWRSSASGSAASTAASASSAGSPAARRSSPAGPWAGSTMDCVATAPTPGRAHGHRAPTENQCDCTAAPSSPVAGSRATIEYVIGAASILAGDERRPRPRRARARAHPRHPGGVRARLRRRLARRAALRRRGAVGVRRPERAVAPDRARGRLAGQGRPPARAAGGRGRAVRGRAGGHAGGSPARLSRSERFLRAGRLGFRSVWVQREITLEPRRRGFHLVTREVLGALPELRDLQVGLAHLLLQHTSASLTLNENASPDVRRDFESWFDDAVPEDAPFWTHTLEGADDMPAHIKASLLGPSLSLPIRDGRLALGTWQGIYLCEHRDRGGARTVIATLNGE